MSSEKIKKKAIKKAIEKGVKKALKKLEKQSIKDDQPSFPKASLDEAITNTTNWRAYNSAYSSGDGSNDFIRAFFMPKADIEGVYQMIQDNSNITGCRVYLGTDIVPTSQPGELPPVNPADGMKLYMVAVEDIGGYTNGQDILVKPNDPTESMIYDFSLPCPSTCDMVSLLYQDSY